MNRIVYQTCDAFLQQNRELQLGLPFSELTDILRQPLTVGAMTMPNRLACQAMEGCDGTADGKPDALTKRRYERLASGGAGLIWFEATAVLPEGRANPRQLYLCKENLDAFRAQADAIREAAVKENGYAPKIILQATHSGRYSKPHGTPEPLIAYHNPVFEETVPVDDSRIVTDDYLDRVRDALVEGAALAEKAGFDGVDIKCCHRYLNSELLSAYERPGRYGGSLENRTRLLRESIAGAMSVTGNDFTVTTRLNLYDGFAYPNGFGVKNDGSADFDPTEPIQLLKELYGLGVRLVNATMGNPYFNPHVNRPYAVGGYVPGEHPLQGVGRMLLGTAMVKQAVPEMKILCSALSYLGIAAPHVAAAMIEQGGFDLAGFGRTIFAYPDFAKDVLKNGELDPKKLCICCSKCTQIMRAGGTPGCVVRDREIYGEIFNACCGGK